MCNIPDYQTRAMPESFLGESKKDLFNPNISFLGLELSDYFDI